MISRIVRRARVAHRCDRCLGQVKVGEPYRRTVLFPADDVFVDTPCAYAECARCLDADQTMPDDQQVRRDEQDTLDAYRKDTP